LFDNLCGEELADVQDKIKIKRGELTAQRLELNKVVKSIRALTHDDSALLHYAERLKKFNKVNSPDINEQFEKFDKIEEAKSGIIVVNDEWSSFSEKISIDSLIKMIKKFEEVAKKNLEKEKCVLPCCNELLVDLVGDHKKERSVGKISRLKSKIDEVSLLVNSVSKDIKDTLGFVETSLDKVRVDIEAEGVAAGSKDRQQKKQDFEEAKKCLEEYIGLTSRWDCLYDKRLQLRKELLDLVADRTNLRKQYARKINDVLAKDLDEKILCINIVTRDGQDKTLLKKWINDNVCPNLARYRESRTDVLLDTVDPDTCKSILLGYYSGIEPQDLYFVVDKPSQRDGKITEDESKTIFNNCVARDLYHFDISSLDSKKLPKEITEGIWIFPGEDAEEKMVTKALELDEIVYDDLPEIHLKDRPLDENSIFRNVEELSPGQRCSAVLPILLLSGANPLIIDQPEDNLDNRLIRQVVVNVLNSMKLRRQVVLATHNPNIPVLGDAENTIVLQAINDKDGEIVACGDLDSEKIVNHITDVMEGGREAFQYRQTIYQAHWENEISSFNCEGVASVS